MDKLTLSQMGAACVVADRSHATAVNKFCREIGGGWNDGIIAWLPDMPFIVLLAYNRLRLSKRAPLILLARDDEALCQAIRYSCSQLDDITCAWVKLVDKRVDDLITPIILADIEAEGTA